MPNECTVMKIRGTACKTFQTEDAFSKCIHNILQRWLIRHIKEVFIIWVAGDVLDFIEEGLRVDSSAVVVAKYLWRKDQTICQCMKHLNVNQFNESVTF